MTTALRLVRISYLHEVRLSHGALRLCSKSSQQNPQDEKPKQTFSRETVRQNVEGYVFTRYFDMVKNYDKVLEKNFPSAMKVYRVFFDGVKDFYTDMKQYMKISRIVNTSPKGLKALNRKELELYMQMPRDMVKVAPVLMFSTLPFVGYAIYPLAFMYPRKFLTSHFWTLQQKAEFQQLKMKERLICNRAVFRCLQAKLKAIEKHTLHEKLKNIFGLLGSGFQPSAEEVLEIRDVFANPPYNILSLSSKHLKLLTSLHGMPSSWFKLYRLTEHAFLVHNMDLAIQREGGVHNMHPDAMKYSCFIRGLNPANLSNAEMIEWLRTWTKISACIEERHISLFLHLPLFLAYNHPNNWQLLHGSRRNKKTNTLPVATLVKQNIQTEEQPSRMKDTKPKSKLDAVLPPAPQEQKRQEHQKQ